MSVCKIDGCVEKVHAKGHCHRHYYHYLIQRHLEDGITCSYRDCPRPVKGRGLCSVHLGRASRGAPLDDLEDRRRTFIGVCKEPGCSRTDHRGKGFCNRHYQLNIRALSQTHYRLERLVDGEPCPTCRQPIPLERRANVVFCSERCRKRQNGLLSRYGVTSDDYWMILEHQSGSCALCRTAPPPDGYLVVDHCHQTGKVRGLLCSPCNLLIGNGRDSDPNYYLRIAAYLKADSLVPFANGVRNGAK